jgi:UDP-glucose 4-epimerase
MENKRVIVTGGGGYIGSHAVLELQEKGWQPFVIDNFSRGSRAIVAATKAPLFEGDTNDEAFLYEVFQEIHPVAVMHFGAYAYVGESVTDPELYYKNNVGSTVSLLSAMRKADISTFIFSSTCATYGEVQEVPIRENTPQHPINPYGHSKLMVEQIIKDFAKAYNLRYLAFRYFNASGAHASGKIGEQHNPETHLIPLTFYAALGKGALKVFGSDYPTPDGTAIRDYIHVSDIAQAHVEGISYLLSGGESTICNLGNETGYSVLEVINEVTRVVGNKVPYELHPRRAGDPPRLVADASYARSLLSWKPLYPTLAHIIESAWGWHRRDAAL